jgi:hypothetical protein
MIIDHYDLYRDNFINDQVGFEPMFPKINDSTQIGPKTPIGETLDLKEV